MKRLTGLMCVIATGAILNVGCAEDGDVKPNTPEAPETPETPETPENPVEPEEPVLPPTVEELISAQWDRLDGINTNLCVFQNACGLVGQEGCIELIQADSETVVLSELGGHSGVIRQNELAVIKAFLDVYECLGDSPLWSCEGPHPKCGMLMERFQRTIEEERADAEDRQLTPILDRVDADFATCQTDCVARELAPCDVEQEIPNAEEAAQGCKSTCRSVVLDGMRMGSSADDTLLFCYDLFVEMSACYDAHDSTCSEEPSDVCGLLEQELILNCDILS